MLQHEFIHNVRFAALFLLPAVLSSFGPCAEVHQPLAGASLLCSNIPVRWNASKQPWPRTLWVYRAETTSLSPDDVSNLMEITGYTAGDQKASSESSMLFTNPGRSGNLKICCCEGTVDYCSAQSYERTNFPHHVPALQQLFKLTTALLPKIGIAPSEISTTENGKRKFLVFESRSEDHSGTTNLTNVSSRSVCFSRALDGVELYGDGCKGEIEFGNQGLIQKLSISWRKVQRIKACPAATPQTIVQWLRENKATYEPATAHQDTPSIDWSAVKQIAITKAQAFYWSHAYPAGKPMGSLSTIHPYAVLLATVTTGGTNLDITIQCPLLEEDARTDSAKSPESQ